jgi:hypothetical protein
MSRLQRQLHVAARSAWRRRFRELGAVDVDVDDLRKFAGNLAVARRAVVEAHAERDDAVASCIAMVEA